MYTRAISLEELFAFFDKEKAQWSDLTDDELSHVRKDPDRFYTLITLIGIFNDQRILAGYCSVPSYSKDILISLYVAKSHRRHGYGSKLINDLKIKHLACLKDNEVGLVFYDSLGFHRSKTSQHLIHFKRNHDR